MAGPLSRDPLRGKVLMSIGRLPTEARRVLDHPCDLWPQREIILISESPGTRAEVGLQPLLPTSGHLERFLLPEDFSTRVWGEASPVTQDAAACLGVARMSCQVLVQAGVLEKDSSRPEHGSTWHGQLLPPPSLPFPQPS